MKKKTFLVTLLVLVIGAAVGAGVYLLRATDTFTSNAGDAQPQLTEQEVQSVVRGVGKLIRLPEGEEPVIASIIDVDQLVATQPFYEGAENGDFLLIYPQAAKAIIYSPKRNIIVNVGPIIIDDAETTGTSESVDVVQEENSQIE